MASPIRNAPTTSPKSSRFSRTTLLVAVAVLLPVGIAVGLPYLPPLGGTPHLLTSPVSQFPPSNLSFERRAIGPNPGYNPLITNVKIVDLDKDGLPDILACDARRNRVFWYRQLPSGEFDEIPIGDEVNSPAVAIPVDLNGDGKQDVVVGLLGNGIQPTDERVGQVVWMENRGDGTFVNHVILSDVWRVSDVQAGDFNGDGKIDLVVAVFGYLRGEILWLENLGEGRFKEHLLFATDGPSHVPVADYDGDGDLDFAALVSQDHEEVWMFVNDGKGNFTPKRIFWSLNFDQGSAGLIAADLDKDGKMDLILSAGDNLEINHNYPQPWHGCFWLKNKGGMEFEAHRIGSVGGVYAAAVADFNGDGHNDVVLACMFNDYMRPGSASVVLLENDGHQNFTAKMISDQPVYLATIAAGDLDGDGKPDIVAGSANMPDPRPEPFGRLTAWFSRKRSPP